MARQFQLPNYSGNAGKLLNVNSTESGVERSGLVVGSDGITTFPGGQERTVTTVNTATYDLLTTDHILNVTYTITGAVTSLTLPTAQSTAGRVIFIEDGGGMAATNNITIDTQGVETIDGDATHILIGDYDGLGMYSDGTNWHIKNHFKNDAYGSMYTYNNGTATTIDVVDQRHAITVFGTGTYIEGFTFGAGTTGPIASFEDYSGTVAGTIKAVDSGHGLSTGDYVTISGTVAPNDYSGQYQITKIDADSFYFTNAGWNATTTATWNQGDYLECNTGHGGLYLATWSSSCTTATNNKNYKFECVRNTTDLDEFAAERKIATASDLGSIGATGMVFMLAGDRLWFKVEGTTDATDMTVKHGNVSLHRI